MPQQSTGALLNCFAFEQLTISTSVVPLTSTKYTAGQTDQGSRRLARMAYVTVDSNPIRYTMDGTTPSASIGHAVAAAGGFWLEGESTIRNFKAIRSGASDAVINVSYF